MKLTASVDIHASAERIWHVISNIEQAGEVIEGIQSIEILKKADSEDGFTGLKWRETRTMFGKTATEVMWITEAKANGFYRTQAESHGAIYKTLVKIDDTGSDDTHRLSYEFDGIPVTVGAKIAQFLLAPLFVGGTRKALQKDLNDIKRAVESQPA
ncbi:MAG: SRPBCC family protein [Deltaproteobacteria bacterium]|nr:SRPBCC family protein [Deltaproteobacteria bacterium]